MQAFRAYFLGKPFLIQTEHRALGIGKLRKMEVERAEVATREQASGAQSSSVKDNGEGRDAMSNTPLGMEVDEESILDCAKIAAPLKDLTRNNKPNQVKLGVQAFRL